jgi:VWFA-related protein
MVSLRSRYDEGSNWEPAAGREVEARRSLLGKVPMKLRNRLLVHLSLALGVCALAGAGLPAAQQSPAASATKPGGSGQAAAAPDRAPAQQGEGTQSFTVKPGTLDEEESPFVIRTTTRRVVVDVVVTGPDGQPVPDLTEKDFTVSEDRKPQSVRAFEVHTPEIDISLLPPAPPQLPSHTFVNLEQTPASGPPVLVLLDYLNTPVTDQAYAHQQIVSFLERKPATMEVAIFALGDNLTLLQGFTTDTSRLLAAMRSKAAGLRIPAQSVDIQKAQTTLDAFLDLGRFLATMNGRKNLLWFSESFNMLVLPKAQDVDDGSLIVQYPANSPNPGPGVTVTMANMMPSPATMGTTEASASGFSSEIGNMMVLREEMRKVATALAVSQTAVYPIDVRGLANDPGMSASAAPASIMTANPQGLVGAPGMPTAPGSPPASVQNHNDWIDGLNAAHATMAEIAEATGGHAFVNTNGLAASAVTAVSEGSSYYTLVYAPANLKFDGGLRSIHVAVDKPGCKLAYRSAYYAVDKYTVTPNGVENDSLAAAMVHGAPEAQGLLFTAQIDPNGTPAMAMADSPLAIKTALNSVKKTKKPQHLSGMVQEYEIRVAILAQQLQLKALADGRHQAVLEIAVYAYAADGQKLGGMKQNLEALMPPGAYAQALQNGMFHNLHVELPVEAATMRLAILDPGNHHAGSMEVALPLSSSQPVAAAAVKP